MRFRVAGDLLSNEEVDSDKDPRLRSRTHDQSSVVYAAQLLSDSAFDQSRGILHRVRDGETVATVHNERLSIEGVMI